MTEYSLIRPVDVLFLRGNKLFADASVHGESVMPPWPSVFAGAIRSRMLLDGDVNLRRFADGEQISSASLAKSLGTPEEPGEFRLDQLLMFRETAAGIELLAPAPADLVIYGKGERPREVLRLSPFTFPQGVCATGAKFEAVPALKGVKREKPLSGWWLTQTGFERYLAGQPVDISNLVSNRELWGADPRLGIGLDPQSRSAAQGMLYTSETIALKPHVGFFVGIAGAMDCLPRFGLVRLGGDGRGAEIAGYLPPTQLPWDVSPVSNHFSLVLSTPGIFPGGSKLPGIYEERGEQKLKVGNLVARLVTSCLTRSEVVSGWNLAKHVPKIAMRTVPRGAVYWFEIEQGGIEELEVLKIQGLWPLFDHQSSAWRQRRAEGFNSVWISAWPQPKAH